MAEAFNLNTFLQTYKNTYDPAKKDAQVQEKMEEQRIEAAEEAVKSSGLLSLTLSEKMAEMGIGERAIKQFADTAYGILTEAINPLEDYLSKYENIFDQNVYKSEIQSYAKQTFFAGLAMSQDNNEHSEGQKFQYTM